MTIHLPEGMAEGLRIRPTVDGEDHTHYSDEHHHQDFGG